MNLKRSWKISIFGAAVFLLSGCTTWYKPGATQQDFDQDKAACVAASYVEFPVATTTIRTGAGYTTPVQTNCQSFSYGNNSQMNCTSTGGEYRPPPTLFMDQNIGARNAAFRSCMYGRGYTTQRP